MEMMDRFNRTLRKIWAISIAFYIVVLYAIRVGIESIARISEPLLLRMAPCMDCGVGFCHNFYRN
jgi:hypothetical protein